MLDFFSGSGTTAHAVMQLNAIDGGSRKWIMVQLPEQTVVNSESYKFGYKTIPDISRERIRRAGEKIAIDIGFRALTVSDTNYKEIHTPASQLQQSVLLKVVDNIKDDRTDLDILYGVLTQSALQLNKPIETHSVAKNKVYLYNYSRDFSGLVACFSKDISEETISYIANLKPLTAVFRDNSFVDSQAKVNLAEHFRVISPDTKLKII